MNGAGHMTKMAAMAMNSKNQKAHDFETRLEASGNEALQRKY